MCHALDMFRIMSFSQKHVGLSTILSLIVAKNDSNVAIVEKIEFRSKSCHNRGKHFVIFIHVDSGAFDCSDQPKWTASW